MLSGPPHKTLTQAEILRLRTVAVANRQLHFQMLRVFVKQQNAKRAVVDETLGEAGNTSQQRVKIENRGHLVPNLGQRFKSVDVVALRFEETRVFDRHRDVRGELSQERFVLWRKCAFDFVQQVQRPDHFPFATQRHGQLRKHVPKRASIARFAAYVIHQDGAPFLHGCADNPLAYAEPNARTVVGIPDRIRNPKFLPFLIEEVHREGAELCEPGDQ